MAESATAEPTVTFAQLQKQYDKNLAEALATAPTAEMGDVKKNFGVFATDPKKYRVCCDALGKHGRGTLVTACDVAIFHAKPAARGGSVPDYDKVDVRATKENIERLLGGKKPALEVA